MHHTFRLQVVSDLHLEISAKALPDIKRELQPRCDHLALCGDIGRPGSADYDHLLQHCSSQWKQVFVTLGNHEYYKGLESHVETAFERACSKYPNVYAMNRRSVLIEAGETAPAGSTLAPALRVLGCTLWSHVPQEATYAVEDFMNDYRVIHVEDTVGVRKFTVDDNNRKHKEDLTWLEEQLKTPEPTIVLTHHAPLTTGTSAPRYEIPIKSTRHAFSTDLSRLMVSDGTSGILSPVKLWCFGHTHWQADFLFNKTRIVTNARGYSRFEGSNYDAQRVYEIEY